MTRYSCVVAAGCYIFLGEAISSPTPSEVRSSQSLNFDFEADDRYGDIVAWSRPRQDVAEDSFFQRLKLEFMRQKRGARHYLGIAKTRERFDSDSGEKKNHDRHGIVGGADEPVWVHVLIWVALVLLACFNAIFNGLTLGLLSLDVMSLEIMAKGAGDKKKRECAAAILPIRQMGNLLLATLLLGNSLTMAVFSILLADVVSPVVAIVLSVTVLFIFCDILPNSICHKYSLQIGARMAWLCWFFIIIFFPVCYPTAKFLDCLLGTDIGTIHSRKELIQMLGIYIEKGALDKETGDVMRGALKNRDRKIRDVMSASDKIYMLPGHRKLDLATIAEIFRSGKSRIPVYRNGPNEIVGLLMTKDLIFCDPDDSMLVADFVRIFGRGFLIFQDDVTVGEAFVKFMRSKSHLAMVQTIIADEAKDPFPQVVGLVTLEDVIEEFIQGIFIFLFSFFSIQVWNL